MPRPRLSDLAKMKTACCAATDGRPEATVAEMHRRLGIAFEVLSERTQWLKTGKVWPIRKWSDE
jgi:hypothetical protein